MLNGTANINGDAPDVALFTSGNLAMTSSVGNVFVQTNDAQGTGIGGSIALGGLYRAAARDAAFFAGIKGAKENATDANLNGYMAFYTRSNGGGTTEKARIDSSGNVAIGTTTASAKLTVAGVIQGQAVSGSGDVLYVGNDAKIVDVDIVNTLGIYSQTTPTESFR